jgi:hypothetical protein
MAHGRFPWIVATTAVILLFSAANVVSGEQGVSANRAPGRIIIPGG